MLTALSAKNKMEFVDGNAPQPPKSDVTYSAWRQCNNMVVSWLVHSVSPSIRQSILWMDKADEIWNDLKSRYSQGDLLRISDLQYEASSLQQGDLSVTEFFTKLRIIWDELENFRPDPTCSCTHKCSCNVLPTIAQRKREDQAMQFLRGLNEQYSNVRSHVLLMDPIPPISKIFSYVAQQERQLLGSNFVANTVTKTAAINATASSFTCTHCGKSGHTENLCYRKHGFPSNHDDKSNRGASNRSGKICIHCGRNGHTIDVCYRKHGFPPGYKSPTGKTSIVNNTVTDECNCFSTSVSTYNLTSWVIDSGATDHISSSLSNFFSYRSINPIVVKLPTGQQVLATHFGLVKFTDTFYLSDVLFIPDFKFNLISISKLVSSLDVQLIFCSTSCVIQDLKTNEKIGTVDVNVGLYTMTIAAIQPSICSTVCNPECSIQSIDLWHFRMGHLPYEKLHSMKQYYPSICHLLLS
uniref:Retrovirus-related Pol polyprotein from transposon TNT 1-94-like beta-barrel domain-containing protein n=1 Tax=Cajanus cajan TaxID=3821 RepID=A0A151TJ88_CAJCA|nr:hypothetical protein KK1_013448 [Cajanus cajan]